VKGPLDKFTKRIVKHVQDRDWEQFHNPKDLSISLALEAAEVLEHFQWKSPEEIQKYLKTNKNDVADELIDVLYWVLLMSHYLGVDIDEAFDRKMAENERKYPIEKVKGKHAKYTAYQDG
jgi:NTP pyrophosphatase (non-canonical NTP hydrolase)